MKSSKITQVIIIFAFATIIVCYHFSMLYQHSQMHSLHYRLNYIPIILAAIWFGLDGGIIAPAAITILYFPFVFLGFGMDNYSPHLNVYLEFVLYNIVGWIVGWLVEDRIRKEEKLEQARRLAMLGELAAGVVHEIKNPIQAIQGALELIRKKSGIMPEIIEAAYDEVKRLDGFAHDFLTLSRPSELNRIETDIFSLINSTLDRLKLAKSSAMPKVIFDSKNTSRTFKLDPEQFSRALWNVIDNAVSFAGKNGLIKIEVNFDNDRFIIDVDDSGPGVPKELRKKIFEPFCSKRSGGTGLGLSIARRVIEAHGGKIECLDSPQGGAKFRITNY